MPSTVAKFRVNGDEMTAKLLEDVIYKVRLCVCTNRPHPAQCWSVFLMLLRLQMHER